MAGFVLRLHSTCICTHCSPRFLEEVPYIFSTFCVGKICCEIVEDIWQEREYCFHVCRVTDESHVVRLVYQMLFESFHTVTLDLFHSAVYSCDFFKLHRSFLFTAPAHVCMCAYLCMFTLLCYSHKGQIILFHLSFGPHLIHKTSCMLINQKLLYRTDFHISHYMVMCKFMYLCH